MTNNPRPITQARRMFASPAANDAQCADPKYANFFARNYAPAAHMAQQFGVDPTLPLGLSALESGWGESAMMRKQNNPFGATPGGGGSSGVSYDSVPSAWQNWGNQWGPRVEGTGSDSDLFVQRLLKDNRHDSNAPDRRGAYNSESPEWRMKVPLTIDSVRRRLAHWQKYGC